MPIIKMLFVKVREFTEEIKKGYRDRKNRECIKKWLELNKTTNF